MLVSLLLMISIALAAAAIARRRRVWIVLTAIALLSAGFIACGGGGSGLLDPTGTPAGTYNITISGASGPVSHSVTMPLIVQ
jgi:hypothetical protein